MLPTVATHRSPVDIGILAVIPPELDAAKDALGILPTDRQLKQSANDTVYWRGAGRSALRGRDYSLVLAGIGAAGTSSAAALASQLVERYRPRVVLLVGIAAGMRGKVRIGDVVLSERVVAYEPAAVAVGKNGKRVVEPRPEIARVNHGLLQDAINYRPDPARLAAVFQRIQGAFPAAPRGKKKEWQEHVAAALTCRAQATIASGDKLLRDPDKLREVRRDIHGKVEVGEMEAAGLVEACRLQDVPWLVIRGISDFGDDLKDDRFHALASRAAAAVMADFIAHGLDLGKGEAQLAEAGKAGERKSPFVVGLPIAREQDFFGRTREKGEILDAIDKGLPAQILGGAKVGKSSLLRWVERHVPAGRPVAWIEPGAGFSPGTLVAAIARKVNKPEVAARVEREGATLRRAVELLREFGELVLILDEADKLATAGQGFDEGFFEAMRGQVESRRITWVSASRRDLYEVFVQKGLTSRFLTSSQRIWVGPLDAGAAQEVAAQGAAQHVNLVLQEAGGFAYGLQLLGNRLLQDGDVDDARDAFRREMKRTVFASWWEGLSAEERALAKACAAGGVRAGAGEDELRQQLNELRDRKLLVKSDGAYGLPPGEAWRKFVQNAG